jgi:hypothetical protein
MRGTSSSHVWVVVVVDRFVYPPRVSGKPPQTYILHTVGIAILIVIALVWFLHRQWG